MNNKEFIKTSYKYLLYSTIAWDWSNRKVEDDPRNIKYFYSDLYKKEFCKDIEKTRREAKTKYMGNKKTSTEYNIYERPDGEVIFAFRGSDSIQDWVADFTFFKQNFKKDNVQSLLSMGSEDFNKLCVNEYMKSREDFFDKTFEFFTQAKMKKIIDSPMFNFKDTGLEIKNKVAETFDNFKRKIEFHGGFLKQYESITKEIDMMVNKYLKSETTKKITFCGHSLGSSLAQLVFIFQSLKHHDIWKDKFSCYVYGTPKIGNSMLRNFIYSSGLGDNLFITNIKTDLIAAMPPNGLGFVENKNNIIIDNIKSPFQTKADHTLFYYLYCYKNKAPIVIKKTFLS